MSEVGKIKNVLQTPKSWRRFWRSVVTIVVVVSLFFSALVAYTYYYNEKVLPGIHLGNIPIGGMEKSELREYIEKMNDKLINEGLHFEYEKEEEEKGEVIIYPVIVSESSSLELVRLDIDAEIKHLIGYGKNKNLFSRIWKILQTSFTQTELKLSNIEIDERRLLEALESELFVYEMPPQDANVKITSLDPLKYNITSSTPGTVYNYEVVLDQIRDSWNILEARKIEVEMLYRNPYVTESDVESIEDRLSAVLNKGGLVLQYTDPHTRWEYEWWIDTAKIQAWLEVQSTDDNGFGFGLDKENLTAYLEETIGPKINREARDAKFSYNEDTDKATEFQGSRPGIKLDIKENYLQINDAILGRTWHDEGITKSITLSVRMIEPSVKTADVNELGIADLLGIGVSDFSGSPRNRRLNIENAVNKLNGTLIPPGEQFSTIGFTKPFTEAGGYLPELVIKGDEIKPEIGGGLCQIGTTLFRMALNSGMEITSRRNHSLVVNYYNDLENGNPGTDATVYDPAPDFRFKNDTEHHVLIQTQVDWDEQRLYFSLWGTNDGRQGYYSKPVVLEWIPYGEKKEIETINLEPGQVKCQHAYTGANTSFTYTREWTDGEKEERVFESHYRPLQEICLIGVEKTCSPSPDNPDEEVCVPVSGVEEEEEAVEVETAEE
jgi:vancomycin resistance protein YoaR